MGIFQPVDLGEPIPYVNVNKPGLVFMRAKYDGIT